MPLLSITMDARHEWQPCSSITINVDVELSGTVAELKELVAAQIDVPADYQVPVFFAGSLHPLAHSLALLLACRYSSASARRSMTQRP